MSHPSKVKGTRWETDVARYLGLTRIGSIYGNKDQGDLVDADWVIECKNELRIDLAGYMDQLKAEWVNARLKPWAVAIVKRRHKPVSEAYAVMPLWMYRDLRDWMREHGDTEHGGA
jgi:NAD(P)H-flavin reductase